MAGVEATSPAPKTPNPNRALRAVSMVIPTETCVMCSKTSLLMESIKVDGKNFHKSCFRCTTCQNVLRLGNFAALEGNYYCKPHFKELFRLKGNYDEGFGRDQHKTKWINGEKGAESPSSPLPAGMAAVSISMPSSPAAPPAIAAKPFRPTSMAAPKTTLAVPTAVSVPSASAPTTPASVEAPSPIVPTAGETTTTQMPLSDRELVPNPARRAIRDQKAMSLGAFNVKNATCFVCEKTVYQMDKVTADGHDYHKACFRCAECNNVLRLGNFAALAGKMYCKPHFKQLFKLKGNYDEGFGREQHKKQWLAENGGGSDDTAAVAE